MSEERKDSMPQVCEEAEKRAIEEVSFETPPDDTQETNSETEYQGPEGA